jgi:hypothetical protein
MAFHLSFIVFTSTPWLGFQGPGLLPLPDGMNFIMTIHLQDGRDAQEIW